jgi:hypothetical protein
MSPYLSLMMERRYKLNGAPNLVVLKQATMEKTATVVRMVANVEEWVAALGGSSWCKCLSVACVCVLNSVWLAIDFYLHLLHISC